MGVAMRMLMIAIMVVDMPFPMLVMVPVRVPMALGMPVHSMEMTVEVLHVVVVVLVLGIQANIEIAGSETVFGNTAHRDIEPAHRQRSQNVNEPCFICARIEQRRDRHVAAYARRAIQV